MIVFFKIFLENLILPLLYERIRINCDKACELPDRPKCPHCNSEKLLKTVIKETLKDINAKNAERLLLLQIKQSYFPVKKI